MYGGDLSLLNPFRRKLGELHKDEGKAYAEYKQASRLAEEKRQKLTLLSIGKDEKSHKGRLGKLLNRMKA